MSLNPKHHKQAGVAQYLTIAETIRGWIASGLYKTGEPIDTVDDLTAKFGVAKRTIQDALKELSSRGVIETSRGKRSIVKYAPRIRAIQSGVHLSETFVLDKSDGFSRKILSATTVKPDKILQNSFPFELTDSLVELRSVLHLKNRPTVYIQSYIPSHLAEPMVHLRGQEMEDAFEHILKTAKRQQSRISATMANLEISQVLSIPIGSPVLRYRRISYCEADNLAVYVEAFFRSDDCEYILGELSVD